ncbi:MAG: hypothetical protein V7K69_01060 [Nostoc sp.]
MYRNFVFASRLYLLRNIVTSIVLNIKSIHKSLLAIALQVGSSDKIALLPSSGSALQTWFGGYGLVLVGDEVVELLSSSSHSYGLEAKLL